MEVSGPYLRKPSGLAPVIWAWDLHSHLLGYAKSQGPRFGCSSCLLAAICAVPNADLIELTGPPGIEVATAHAAPGHTCLDR